MAARSICLKTLFSYSLKSSTISLQFTHGIQCHQLRHCTNISKQWFSFGVLPCDTLVMKSKQHKELCDFQMYRFYSKSRDKKKSDKGQKKKVQVTDEVLAEVINAEAMQGQMLTAVERLKDDFIKNLSLRSTSGSIESLPVTFEGKDYILQDLAQVVRKNPKTVVINMAAFPQVIPTVIQVITKSGMNLNPQQDGTTIFLSIPKVTKEHRETLSKNAKAIFIKCRDSIKDVQNKFIKTVKNKEKDGLSKDTSHLICDFIMSAATEHISAAEKILEAKQQELLQEG